jgi:signal transduction histidine kinase
MQGLSSNRADVIIEDLGGKIYVMTGRGLDRLDPETGRVKHFTTADGLASGVSLSAYRDRDGTLWFGTSNGLSSLAPSGETPTDAPPPILITRVKVSGESQAVSALGEIEFTLPELPAHRNQLQIDFVGLSFAPGDVLRYQYQLEGTNANWSEPSEQRTVNFVNIAPGQYRFLVRAVNSDGVASLAPAIVTFAILRPVWQRWWFLLLAAFALGLVVYALYRHRIARLLEVANMRTRIATDLHDDIGANLTKIAILSEVARQQLGNGDAVRDRPLSSIARISRESVAAMSDIVWAINPQRDTLRDLVRRIRQHAEEVCLSQNIEVIFRAPDREPHLRLGVDIRRDLYLIFKEAITNSVRHSECTRLEIELAHEEAVLALTIVDNGKGFDPGGAGDGNGLINMRRRAERHAGKIVIESQSGQGTTIKVHLPHARSRRPLPT